MILTTEQAIAVRHLLAATPMISGPLCCGDRLVKYYKYQCNATTEQAENLTLTTLKILNTLNSELKEYLA